MPKKITLIRWIMLISITLLFAFFGTHLVVGLTDLVSQPSDVANFIGILLIIVVLLFTFLWYTIVKFINEKIR